MKGGFRAHVNLGNAGLDSQPRFSAAGLLRAFNRPRYKLWAWFIQSTCHPWHLSLPHFSSPIHGQFLMTLSFKHFLNYFTSTWNSWNGLFHHCLTVSFSKYFLKLVHVSLLNCHWNLGQMTYVSGSRQDLTDGSLHTHWVLSRQQFTTQPQESFPSTGWIMPAPSSQRDCSSFPLFLKWEDKIPTHFYKLILNHFPPWAPSLQAFSQSHLVLPPFTTGSLLMMSLLG